MSEATTPKVEDLVKKALKEALDKRRPPASDVPTVQEKEGLEMLEELAEDMSKDVTSKKALGPNQVYFSDVIGDHLIPMTEDFGVTVF